MSNRSIAHGAIVWKSKPYITPLLIIRTTAVYVVAVLMLLFEFAYGLAFASLGGLDVYAWTLLIFTVIWLISILHLLFVWASNTYVLRQDGLEVRRGIIRLHSFVVTPSGFGDLEVYQSISGRIFNYGQVTVNSQGEKETKLILVRNPFATADRIRDIMGKPIVRL